MLGTVPGNARKCSEVLEEAFGAEVLGGARNRPKCSETIGKPCSEVLGTVLGSAWKCLDILGSVRKFSGALGTALGTALGNARKWSEPCSEMLGSARKRSEVLGSIWNCSEMLGTVLGNDRKCSEVLGSVRSLAQKLML